MIWLLHAARWVRNPPSAGRVMLVVAIIGIGIAIASIEHMGWWPDWATQDRMQHRAPPR